jgi:hypothetical protein
MKAILAFVALLAMVGVSMGLNPQPEPPARMLEDLGRISIVENVMTIDLGQVRNIDAAVQQVINTLNTKPVVQDEVIILVNGQAIPLVKNHAAVVPDITTLLMNKI